MCSLSEAKPRTFHCLLRLDSAIFGWSVCLKRVDQRSGDLRNVAHRLIKCGLIEMGRLCESTDLSDKLKRGSLNFRLGCGRLEIKEWSDVSTHTL